MAVSYLLIDQIDSSPGKPATAHARIPITAQTVPTHVATLWSALAPLFGGNTNAFISSGGVARVAVEIDLGITEIPPAAAGSDARDQWEATPNSFDSSGRAFRFSTGIRNTNPDLLFSAGKGQIANISQATWLAFLAALATSGAALTNPDTGTAVPLDGSGNVEMQQIRAIVRPRSRPRI